MEGINKPMETVIELNQVSRSYGSRQVVDQITFSVDKGEICGFLGPNGAGKTTTLRMILGLVRPTSGKIAIRGTDVAQARAQALVGVGAIIEESKFYTYLTGLENLQQACRMRGMHASRDHLLQKIAAVGLDGSAALKRVGTYSLGMRQRLALALALVQTPEVLILDEPMNGMDPTAMRSFREHLKELAEQGVTILLSSHLLAEVEQMATRLVFIDQGRIKGIEKPQPIGNQWILIRTEDNSALRTHCAAWGYAAVAGPQDSVLVAIEREAVPEFLRQCILANLLLFEVRPYQTSLESRYLDIMGEVTVNG